jgi:hypothetical protein
MDFDRAAYYHRGRFAGNPELAGSSIGRFFNLINNLEEEKSSVAVLRLFLAFPRMYR